MLRVPVISSNLKSVGYDPKSQTLEIEFLSRDVWRYSNVPPEIHAALMNAPSKGTYFSAHIKKYPARYPPKQIL
jgi:hypothetical protein